MKRREFLRKISFTGAAVVAAPAIVLASSSKTLEPMIGVGVREQMEASNCIYYDHRMTVEHIEALLAQAAGEVRSTSRSWQIYTDSKGYKAARKAERKALYEYLNK